jgi:transposase
MRRQEAIPILDEFSTWIQKQYLLAQPKSAYGKALFYCMNNWTELTEYAKDGRLQIDNNYTEREMKVIAMGRKAWLFFGSDRGGRDQATIMSLLATCRRHIVEPLAYLTDIIRRLIENPGENLEELLPYKWKCKYPQTLPTEIPGIAGTLKVA